MENEIHLGRSQVLENSIAEKDYFTEKDAKDTANGLLEKLLQLKRSFPNRPDDDRILPTPEPQTTQNKEEPTIIFPSSGSINFQKDFEDLDRLHLSLGIDKSQRMAHDPAKDRARFERAKTDEDRQAVKQGVITDMEKTLYERAFTSQSTVTYYQDDEGRIYHPKFPGEPFDIVLQRGLEDARRNGFVDYEREVAEFAGWKEAMKVLFSAGTPIESKEVIKSPPSLKKGTAFTDNFVDILTKKLDPDTGRIVVEMTRFASGVDYDGYAGIAARLDKNYFAVGQPEAGNKDVFYKAHPIFIDSRLDSRTAEQIFNQEFKRQERATEEEKTKVYIEKCKSLILHYAETICAEFVVPETIKKTFRAAINKFDSLRKGLVEAAGNVLRKVSDLATKASNFFRNTQKEIDQAEIEYYGRMPIQAMMVGCGLSGDFSSSGIGRAIRGSIASGLISIGTALGLLESDSMGSLYFVCPACGATNKRPREGTLELCKNTACPDPTAVACGSAGKEEEQKEDSNIIAFPSKTSTPVPTELPKAA